MVKLFDTTLRDGTQGLGVSFSAEDKIKVACALDEIGTDYIEGGWPGSNPKDAAFFAAMRNIPLKHSVLTAFGSTRRSGISAQEDVNLNALVASGVSAAAIFGKSWDFHVTNALLVGLDENLRMIEDSVRFLKDNGLEVIYDAEHFFDAFKANREYAMDTIKAAVLGGADWLVLCDTNGGTMPWEIGEIIDVVRQSVQVPIGIHAHNDCELGVANSLEAIRHGACMIHGTINGLGERCGNANLISVIADMKLKMGIDCIPIDGLARLTRLSRFVSEIANMAPYERQPFVGRSAFAHKGGMHVNALRKDTRMYEHIDPELVGNKRDILVSELSGISNILAKAEELSISVDKNSAAIRNVLDKIKLMESKGYNFEDAEASFELILMRELCDYGELFDFDSFRVINEKREDCITNAEATIKLAVAGHDYHTAGSGDGPVNALDNALRKALKTEYPAISAIRLIDYKVRVLNTDAGTEALVRVTIETSNGTDIWATVGVSTNVIEASWLALLDSLEYGLIAIPRKI